VLNSMEEARETERRKAVRARHPERGGPLVDLDASAPVVERIALLRSALDELEVELSAGRVVDRAADDDRASGPGVVQT